ncbi:MAG: CRISPR-associated endonuclease Cas1 [Nitrospirae bacterium]|nr:CRISPR-associated endonuclease Cas1 [Nitrospirota bacterium]
MGTLYVDKKGIHIKEDGNALAFYANGNREGIVPVKPLNRVVIVGSVTIESSALHKLAQEGITVVFLSGRSLRVNGIFHGSLHNNGILRVKQYEKSVTGFSKVISLEIIKKKVESQCGLLKDAINERPDKRLQLFNAIKVIESISEKITILSEIGTGDWTHSNDAQDCFQKLPDKAAIMGLEGGAASTYFQAYTELFASSLNFSKRTKRPPEDPVNAMLSLCYTILHYEMVREIEVIGLDPFIGFYHTFEYGRESLACDLIELFRASVDKFVWYLFREREFTIRDFFQDGTKPGCYLKKECRKKFYPIYEEWAKEMRPKYIETVRELARRITDG